MLNREIWHTNVDVALLILEHMQMIDIGHSGSLLGPAFPPSFQPFFFIHPWLLA
jgi:hypothetical protein